MYPLSRNRRLRSCSAIRSLVKETQLSSNDFIVPIFVVEGKNIKKEIASMPDYFYWSLDLLDKEIKELWKAGLKAVLIFAKIDENLKDNSGSEALNKDGLMQRAIKVVKNRGNEDFIDFFIALNDTNGYEEVIRPRSSDLFREIKIIRGCINTKIK